MQLRKITTNPNKDQELFENENSRRILGAGI